MCENDVKGVERSLNSFNCYSCYCTHVKRVKSGVCGLCTQYRYIQCYVERVKRVKRLCYVETRDKHIFAHNFLNIQAIFNPKKAETETFPTNFLNIQVIFNTLHWIVLLERSKSQLSKTFFRLKIA